MAAISHIAFGDGGVDSTGNPIQPAENATGLNNELGRFAVKPVTYPVPTTARYETDIPAADLPGASISEAALVDSAGAVHAIKTFFIKRKDAGVTFTFTFDDEF
jgi:hypothetical protein